MTDHPALPPGFPGGFVPVAGVVEGDGEVRPISRGNGVPGKEAMEAAFGRHPDVDSKHVPTPAREWIGRKRKRPRR